MRTRRRPLYVSGRRRTLALAVAVAASVVTPLAVYGADQVVQSGDDITATAGGGLPTGETAVPLAEAPPATGVDSDVASGGSPVREVTSETPFSMVGVTWKGHDPAAVAQVRAKNPDGSWGPWYEAESTDGKGESVTGTGGTEPVYLGLDTTAVQISLSGIDIEDTSLADAPEATPDEPAKADTRSADEAEAPTDEDVAAARTADLPDVTTFTLLPGAHLLRRFDRPLRRLLASRGIAAGLEKLLAHLPGPSESARTRSRSAGWVRLTNAGGHSVERSIEVDNTYVFTAKSMVQAMIALAATPVVGALTPSQAFGVDFIDSIPGVRLVRGDTADVPSRSSRT